MWSWNVCRGLCVKRFEWTPRFIKTYFDMLLLRLSVQDVIYCAGVVHAAEETYSYTGRCCTLACRGKLCRFYSCKYYIHMYTSVNRGQCILDMKYRAYIKTSTIEIICVNYV